MVDKFHITHIQSQTAAQFYWNVETRTNHVTELALIDNPTNVSMVDIVSLRNNKLLWIVTIFCQTLED